MPVIQCQSAVLVTSITSAKVSAAAALRLQIKMPAMVTFYRGHHRTLGCLPGIISLIIMCIGIISDNYFYVGRSTLPGCGLDWTPDLQHTARFTLYCTWRQSDITTGLHEQATRLLITGGFRGQPIQRTHCWLQGFKGLCHGNKILAKIDKNITKMGITLVVCNISMQSLVIMATLCGRCGYYIFALWFLLSSFILSFFLA